MDFLTLKEFSSSGPSPHISNIWLLECQGNYEAILKKIDPTIRSKIIKIKEAKLYVEQHYTQQVFAQLALKSSLYFQKKMLHVDLYNKAFLEPILTYQHDPKDFAQLERKKWMIRTRVKINNFNFFLDEAFCCAAARWIIHSQFFYLIEDSTDKRAILEGMNIKILEDQEGENLAVHPHLFNGYSPLIVLSELSKPLIVMQPIPFLKIKDYGLTEIELWSYSFVKGSTPYLIDDPENKTLSWYQDLLEMGAHWWPSKSCFKWNHPDLACEALVTLQEIGWKIEGPKQEKICILQDLTMSIQTNESHWLEAKGEASFSMDENKDPIKISLGALGSHIKKALKLIPFDKDFLGLLPSRWNQQLTLIKKAQLQEQKLQWQPWQIGATLEWATSSKSLKFWQQLVEAKTIDPSTLCFDSSLVLRPYQKQGICWLLKLWSLKVGGLLADDMGLGKTVQALIFLGQIQEIGCDLVIMPLSLLSQWKKQAHTLLGYTPLLHHGSQRATQSLLQEPRLVLSTYQTLVQDLEIFLQKKWRVIIFDESHLMRNPNSLMYQAARSLQAEIKIGMSGTPIFNSLDDLWVQMKIFASSLLQDESAPLASQDPLLGLSPLWLRRTKDQVATDLPEKIEQLIWLDMEETQQNLYHKVLQSQVKESQKETTPLEILEKILRLRQCCLHPLLIDPSFQGTNIKQIQLINDLSQILASNHKVIIFSQFSQVLKPMHQAAINENFECFYIDSSTKARDKQIEGFTDSLSASALFMTLGSGGVGLNLTSASYVILLDPWWNESAENQAIDRAHRIGQRKSVTVLRYLLKDTLEEAMQEIKEDKKTYIHEWQASNHSEQIFNEDSSKQDCKLFSILKQS
jgi:superfamily II DNA or RNA helicase